MSNQTIKNVNGKYAAALNKAPETGEEQEDKAPAIKGIIDFDADGKITLSGQFGPENIRKTKKSGAPYVSIAFDDSYPLRSGTATVYLSSSFLKEIDG